MSSSAVNIYFASAHPWSSAIRALSDISIPAFVIQIHDEENAMAKLRFASTRHHDKTQQMAVASWVSDVCSNLSIIDSTPAFLRAIDKKTLHAATNYILCEIKDVSVSEGLGFLKGLLTGAMTVDIPMANPLSLPRAQLTVHSRNSEKSGLQILVSVQWKVEQPAPSSSVRLFAEMLNAAADIVVGVSLNGKVEFINRGASAIVGKYTGDSSRDISRILSPESARKFAQVSTLIARSNEPWSGVLTFASDVSRETIAANCQISLVRDASDRNVIGYCISGFRNINMNPLDSQSKPLSKDSDESARMAMVGKIAHHTIEELDAPLAVIRGKADKIHWLLQGMSGRSPSGELSAQVSEAVSKIVKMGERIDSITRGMKNLSRNAAAEESAEVSLTEVLAEVFDLVDGVARKANVRLEIEPGNIQKLVPMQRLRISQVLVNLVVNACEAVASLDEKWVNLNVVSDDEWIYITVTDSGQGISPELKTRLFDPFFSTKGTGRGAGIGLNLSRQIVREHGGDLYLDESSIHTRFVIELPLAKVQGVSDSQEEWEEI